MFLYSGQRLYLLERERDVFREWLFILFKYSISWGDNNGERFLGWLFPFVNISIRWDKRGIAEYEEN